jgi:Arc/MetJ-type ribon-helix-helix transcriptional regulator
MMRFPSVSWPKKKGEEKVQLSVSVDKDLIDWVKEGVEKKTFAHVSHAFELALTQLRERSEKKDKRS